MFTQLRDKMKNDLLKNDIKYDNNSMWYDKNTR